MLRDVSNLLIHSRIKTKQIQGGEHAKDTFMLKTGKQHVKTLKIISS